MVSCVSKMNICGISICVITIMILSQPITGRDLPYNTKVKNILLNKKNKNLCDKTTVRRLTVRSRSTLKALRLECRESEIFLTVVLNYPEAG